MGLIKNIENVFESIKNALKARGAAEDLHELVDQGKEQVTQLVTEAGHDVEQDAETVEADVHNATGSAADAPDPAASGPDAPAAQ